MKIEQVKNRKNSFGDLKNGDCFQWRSDFLLKTKRKGTAVNLEDGEVLFFNNEDDVITVTAKVVIE